MNTPKKNHVFRAPRLTKIIITMLLCLAGLLPAVQAGKIFYAQNTYQASAVKMISILRAQGHTVTVWNTGSQGNVPTAATLVADGYTLLIADESIGSGNVGALWRNSTIPVINWEGFLYSGNRSAYNADTGLTGGTYADSTAFYATANGAAGADYGQIRNTNIEIVNAGHPLAAGLGAGAVQVFNPALPGDVDGPGVITFIGTRTLSTNVQIVARVPGVPEALCIWGVDANATLSNGTTNLARWVHLPWNTSVPSRELIEPSYYIFEAGVAWALGLPQPVKISNLTPAGGSFLPTNTLVSCSVSKTNNAGSAVASGNIIVKVDGTNASSGVSITDGGSVWNVSYTNGFPRNRSITVTFQATAADGGLGARQTAFDTFSATNFMWEAEDFNFGGGQFFDNITLCTNVGGGIPNCYFDRFGYTNIDKSEINFAVTIGTPVTNEVYRFGPQLTVRDEYVDTFLTGDPFIRAKYTTAQIPDYEVRNIVANEWLNYTRTYPTGSYKIYARVNSTAAMGVQLDFVTGNPTTTSQFATNKIGRFVASAAGTGGYQLVPLTDDAGNVPIIVELTNPAPTTIRATAITAGFLPNYYMLVPSTLPANVPPSITMNTPADRTTVNEGTVVAVTTTPLDTDGTISSVTFYVNDVPVKTNTSAPYNYNWTAPNLGAVRSDYVIKAIAKDNGGLTAEAQVAVFAIDPTIVRLLVNADVTLGEVNGSAATDTGADSATSINARAAYTGTAVPNIGNVSEVSAIRFDLTGYNVANLQSLAINLINQRVSQGAGRVLHFYAVKDGTVGLDNNGKTPGWNDNTWVETDAANLAFSTMPGLIYTGTCTNQADQGIDPATTVDLGSATLNPTAKESIFSFSSPALTAFIKTNADALMTFLFINENDSTGQIRFGSKESTSLESGPTGPAGSFGPFLSFRVQATPPTLTYSVSGNNLTLSWAGSGYKLIAQTNNLSTGLTSSWANYPGGTTSPVVVPIDKTKGSVFFGLAPNP